MKRCQLRHCWRFWATSGRSCSAARKDFFMLEAEPPERVVDRRQRSDDAPEWTLVIFGEGQERARLERLRDELGLAHRVGMPGITAAPGQWVEGAEIFALSSRFEGFSNVLMEAMSGALAVVSFDCPWSPGEIVRHEVDGVLAPAEDVAALADALRRLTADQDLRRRLGNAARTGVRRFAAEPIMGLWNELIVDAMQASRRRARGVG
jgi:glycosyltransferase involved in cell wall biosynthesis